MTRAEMLRTALTEAAKGDSRTLTGLLDTIIWDKDRTFQERSLVIERLISVGVRRYHIPPSVAIKILLPCMN